MIETKARRQELEVALKQRLDAMDAVTDAFKIEDNGGVVVSSEKRDFFRKQMQDANEIKSLIADLDGYGELKGFLEAGAPTPEALRSAAVAAAAGGSAFGLDVEGKSLGELFTGSDEFKALVRSGGAHMQTPWEVNKRDIGGMGVKDVYTTLAPAATSRGFGRTQRDPMIPLRQRQSRVRDLFPVATTDANLIDYYRVSGFTNNAAPVPERTAADGSPGNVVFGLKPQSALAFTLAQAPVRTIAHLEVAHRNVLADEPQLQATINNELLYGLRLAEDAQIINGDGTGENLLGILLTPGIQSYTQGQVPNAGETKVDAMRRAATRVILAYYEATGFVIHPYDWEDVELQKDTTGQYVLVTNVAIGAEQRVWRQPVVDTPAIPEGTFVTGAWGLGAQLYDREQANIRIAEQHADLFARNAVAILAEERLAFAVKRPESFVKGTFI